MGLVGTPDTNVSTHRPSFSKNVLTLGGESMAYLIKEDRYIYFVGAKKHTLRVHELLWGSPAWPGRFRIQVPASKERDGKEFYGKNALEVVDRVIEYLYWHSSGEPHRRIELNSFN